MGAAGAVPVLLDVLETESAANQRQAARALRHLLFFNKTNGNALLEANDGVGRMLKVVAACQDPSTVEHLARALANGASQNLAFSAALRDGGGIAVLADTMAAPSNSLE